LAPFVNTALVKSRAKRKQLVVRIEEVVCVGEKLNKVLW
jgi:hypothetical protein